jgi:hypothetical protein
MAEHAQDLSGGCQCGAIRYSVQGEASNPAICHCRMCQKAVGSIMWPFFSVRLEDLVWTRGRPALYRSSEAAERGFCSACGTPLSFHAFGDAEIDLSIGSLDEPAHLKPRKQHWPAARMPWFGELAGLPDHVSTLPAEEIARRHPHQHPDHDTAEWPPSGQRA